MDTIINNSRAPAKIKGNRYYQTMTPSSPEEVIQLIHMGCVGDTVISKIQLEKGTEPTAFEMPRVTTNEISGIFSALQGLRVQMADKESSLWSEIIANNKAMLVAYHNDTISGSIGISADAIRQEIKDTLDGRTTSLTQNLNGFQQRVQDAISKSTVTQLSNLYDRKFETVNGNVSQLSQNVDGLRTRVATAEGKASEATQTISGFRQTVNGLNDTYSSWTQTVNGFRQDLRGINGNYSSLSQLVTGLQSTVRDNERDIESKVTQLSGLIENKVSSSDFVSTIRQNADSIALALNGKVAGKMSGPEIISAINIATGGVGIYSGSNKLVVTPDTTYIQSGTIKSAMIEELDGGKIKAGTITSKHIETDAITADKLKVDQGLFTKLLANEAYIQQLFAKQAFLIQLQSVDLTASQIKGGILRSLNGSLAFDLNNSVLNTYSNNSAIRRVSDGQSQFLKMAYEDGTTWTTLGANRKANDESIGSADFTGIQIVSRGTHKGYLRDKINIFGDEIRLDGGGATDDGLHFKNNQWFRPEASGRFYLGMNGYRWREVHSNEYYINGIVLSSYLKSIRECLNHLANAGAQQSTYDYIKNQISNVLGRLP